MTRVDFYYSIGSRYAYLAASQLDALERDTGCRIDWHPLNGVRLRAERERDPFQGEPVSGQYEWPYRERDARRWAAFYGIPFVEPRGRLELDPELLALACTAARRLGRVEAVSRALFAAVFEGRITRIDAEECVRQAAACGLEATAFERELGATETADALDATLRAAHAAGVFGVPTWIVGGELFWGNDRLPLLRHQLLRG